MDIGPARETMSADDIEREALFLLTGLTEVAELESVYAELSVEIPETCRGKTSLLLKFFLRYLNSEALERGCGSSYFFEII